MTRPNLFVGALAAVCGGTLLWCARLILAADLPLGAHIASWALWVLSAVAVVTLVAYVREFLLHRQHAGSDASWKPLPSLVLLWIGGLTALLSFAFMLPSKAAAEGASSATAGTSLIAQTQTPTPNPATTTAVTSTSRPAASSASSRSVASRSAAPSPVSTAPQAGSTSGAPAPRPSTSTSTPSSSTTSPLVNISIFPTQSQRTKPPRH